MTTHADSPISERPEQPSWFKRVLLWAGLAGLLQFMVFGPIGIARGYSIQSWAPLWIMLAGVMLLMPFSRKKGLVSFLPSASILLYALVSLSQGRNKDKGDELHEAGKFADAMVEYREENDAWSHRLSPVLPFL